MTKDAARLVLVVEDDVSVRRPLVKFLEMHGFSVVTGETADEGLELMKRHRFVAAVVDLRLKRGSGRDVIRFANNIFRGNKDGYDLSEHDHAVIVVVRHRTAPFAFNDAMWAKYGKPFAERMQFTDPKTKQTPATNFYGPPLSALVKQGVHLGVCNLTTRSISQRLSELTGK